MKVTTKFLFRVVETVDGWVAVCLPALLATEPQATRTDALLAATQMSHEYLDAEGRTWVNQWQSSEDTVTCPEGRIKLPIDLWYCKLTKKACPIQAQVFVEDEEHFAGGCDATPERRQAILETIRSGRYGGAHHVPGRYLCTGCRHKARREPYRYHYPWELQQLADHTLESEIERVELRRALAATDLPIGYMHSAICADCTNDAVAVVVPELAGEFAVITAELAL